MGAGRYLRHVLRVTHEGDDTYMRVMVIRMPAWWRFWATPTAEVRTYWKRSGEWRDCATHQLVWSGSEKVLNKLLAEHRKGQTDGNVCA